MIQQMPITDSAQKGTNGLPDRLADYIILNVGEQVKRIWECSNFDEVIARNELDMFTGKKSGMTSTMFALATAKSAGRCKGFLVLTDRRAVYIIHKEYSTGIFEKKINHRYEFKISFNYEAIVSARTSERYFTIDIDNQGGICNQNFYDIMELNSSFIPSVHIPNNQAKEIMMLLIRERLQAMEEEKRKSRVSFIIDFSFLKDSMAKGGIIVQNIKCPSCGASVVLPSHGSSMMCEYCRTTIHAQDVFEKMKGLIGELKA